MRAYILNRFALKIKMFSNNLFYLYNMYHTMTIFPERMVLPALLVRQLSSRSWQSRTPVLNTYRCLHASPYSLAQSPTVLKGTCCLGARYTFGCWVRFIESGSGSFVNSGHADPGFWWPLKSWTKLWYSFKNKCYYIKYASNFQIGLPWDISWRSLQRSFCLYGSGFTTLFLNMMIWPLWEVNIT